MQRKIIHIDQDKCNGCGACADACHEGAIAVINGKARLMRDDFCDGLGDCLPACPAGAITFTMREAAPYNEQAVLAHKQKEISSAVSPHALCPGARVKTLSPSAPAENASAPQSRLSQWPVQIKLVPVNAPFFNSADLLIAADCTAYAYAPFHERFIKGHITLIGCPKLDNTDYSQKLAEIIKLNNIQSITVVRMQVPCCGGLEHAAKTALQKSGKSLPFRTLTVTANGTLLP